MRLARGVGMKTEWIDCVVEIPVDPVEVIKPNLPQLLPTHPTMAIGCCLDEHRWGSVVKMPTQWNLDNIDFFASLPRLHPVGGILGVINFSPAIPLPQIIGMAIFFHEGEVVLEPA